MNIRNCPTLCFSDLDTKVKEQLQKLQVNPGAVDFFLLY
jgi:hypothetical protein